MSAGQLAVAFFLQMAVILAACRVVGMAARRIGQPQVVGEILMELIVINIGLQHGIIQPPLLSVLVLMAIVTTLMASPVFEWVYDDMRAPPRPGPSAGQ